MNASLYLADTFTFDHWSPIFLTLFWIFAVAALVWLVIWLLFCRGDEDVVSTQAEDSGDPPADTAPVDELREMGIDTASEEEARALFADELNTGTVSQDSVYGIIYHKLPAEGGSDDLKLIKGVAEVLEGKLNDIGVYRFKQVAVWTDTACEEFSKMLTFKDRIYRDNWIAQAKDFHEKKYNEKL